MRLVDYIIIALENLDGQSSYDNLYKEVKRLYNIDNKILPKTWKANIRARIEEHSIDTDSYKDGYPKLFTPVYGKGKGFWGLTHNYQKELYYKPNQKGLIVAYCLAKYNKEAYLEFGYKDKFNSQKEVERDLSMKLGMKQNSYLKQMRDKFDTLFDFRIGYVQDTLPRSFYSTAELLEDLNRNELFSIVKKLLNNDEYFQNNFSHLIAQNEKLDKKKHNNYNPKQRLKTGKMGERLFEKYFLKEGILKLSSGKNISGNLKNTTEDQCGYDFEILADEGKYCIEVKSLSSDSGSITFTSKEWEVAKQKKEFFIICLVYNINSEQKEIFKFIEHPSQNLEFKEREVLKIQMNYEISNKALKTFF
ncbi:DUF3883 domain-containing protein [Candidatus Marinimicrobia bacterium]|nr:DUF3883 domain-containing protein [Candidatus Neomarinimicrobiota bacterium]